MFYIYILLLLIISIIVELLIGGCGIVLPVTASVVFYFSVVCGWKNIVVFALSAGFVIDVLYGRGVMMTPFLMLVAVMLGRIWLYRAESQKLIFHILPGGLLAGIYTLPLLFNALLSFGTGFKPFLYAFSSLSFAIFFNALFLPFIIVVLDACSDKFGFKLYAQARDRITERR